jgi:uncharacterized protein (DUF1697 family)
MPTYVSLLRGINVSGHNRISMADLRALYEAHGHHDVSTYVQSGNVVSRSSARSTAAVARAMERAITDDLGLDVTVLVRTPAQLAKLVDTNPLVVGGADPGKLHVTFLASKPARAQVDALDGRRFAPDEFVVVGDAVYVVCPNGYGRTKVNNTYFERTLEVAATTRNWKTVNQLLERGRGGSGPGVAAAI